MTSITAVGRQPIQIVEIDQDICRRTYGVSPCLATAANRCYKTRKTCIYTSAYRASATPLTLRFSTAGTSIPLDAGYVMPFLVATDTTPTRINPGGTSKSASPFGERATASITLIDAPHSGYWVDPHLSTRTISPLSVSTFWVKWLSRNPYYAGRKLRVKNGYVGQPFAEWRVRNYVLDSIAIDPKSNKVVIKAKDALKLADDDRAVAPKPTKAVLASDITSAADSLVVSGAALADVPVNGTLRIGTECMTYTGRSYDSATGNITVTGIARGTDGTASASHKQKDSAQVCLRIQSANSWDVAKSLLVDYAGLPASYIDDWSTEGRTWLAQFAVSALITEPVGVTTLLGELCQQVLMYIWWDEFAGLVKLSAVKPVSVPSGDINDSQHIIANSVSMAELADQRITQCWIFYGQIDPTKKVDEPSNYRSLRINLDANAENVTQYGDTRIFKIYSRWIDTDAKAISIASRYIARFRTTPKKLRLSLDAKDSGIAKVANGLDVSTYCLTDFDGNPLPTRFEVLSVDESESGHKIDIELQSTEFDGSVVTRYAYIMQSTAPDYVNATASQRSAGCWIANSSGKIPTDNTDGYLVI